MRTGVQTHAFLRSATIGILITLNFMGIFSGWLRAASYHDESSKLIFPDKIGALQRGNPQKYEAEPGQGGVAVPYRGQDAEVTVYVRRVGAGATAKADDALKDALSGIKQMEVMGQYSDVKIYSLDPSKVRVGWAGAAFTSKPESRFIVSFIYCTVKPEHLVKVRATTGDLKNEQLTADLDALLKTINAGEKKPEVK